ncbi:hypothetical protein K7X08_014180 [Anisodus acutangulus]|uniref:Peptidase S8/S53 domain-containing protein n=1 Tax=Anisodus acutangulus TaxID=402998 RepID=A0A9Q1R2M5_9SOLA|nr:hypothetical protein K7X08_014180 [Anisodus acutangulus]
MHLIMEIQEKRKVKGEIVYSLGSSQQDSTIKYLKGAGAIIVSDKMTHVAFPTYLSATDINTTYAAQPDIAAPGLSILVAYSGLTSLNGDSSEGKRIVKYYVESGTSMACPHVAAAAAYVKSFRPDWSPAAIKSALMTTSTIFYTSQTYTTKSMKIRPVGAELASGSGQINPRKAINPGLIYDLDFDSYISYFCKEGYNSTNIALLTGSKKYKCSSIPKAKGADGLNYPSMHLQLQHANESDISAIFYRTVTCWQSQGCVQSKS